MIRIGIIGYGYWGPNLVRNFVDSPDSQVAMVSDLNPARLAEAKRRYPGIAVTGNFRDMIKDAAIDAIVVATPLNTHFELAMESLEAGKHVLVEKPMTATSEQAKKLIEKASKRRLTLMVDHTFVYEPAVQFVKQAIEKNRLGKLYYYDSVRVNLGIFQHDTNVLWDLACHDLSIMDYVLDIKPRAVSAVGSAHIPNQPENIAYVTCFFDGNFLAHFHVNWLAPAKVRYTLIGGERRMLVYNDLKAGEKIRVFDRGVNVSEKAEGLYEKLVSYRIGNMWAPKIDQTEALRTETQHFIKCIQNQERPITDAEAGLRVVQLLEAADRSLRQKGQAIDLPL